jgi:serine/threonine-protein kinase RsbW
MIKSIEITNNLEEMDKVAAFIEELGDELELSMPAVMNINLALEEAIANVIMYAYPKDSGENKITLTAEKTDEDLVFTLTDKGIAFDPTQVPEADITKDAADRPIGGLGIFLIRKIMGKVSYQRINDENQLKMSKKLTDPK